MCRRFFVALALAVLPVGPLDAQVAVKDPQSVTILTQTVNAAEGTQAGSIRDFVATGSITYFWAGEQVPGSATVKGRAPDQFRLDANLAAGTRSYVASHGVGALKDTSGTITSIPYHNTINVGVPTLPYFAIAAHLSDPMSTIINMGTVTSAAGATLQDIRTQEQFTTAQDSLGMLTTLTITDYLIDPTTKLVIAVIDATHPVQTMTEAYPHEIDLENYSATGGVNVPMLVREKINGQTIWELRLSTITFNAGLTDADFVLQ